MIGANTLKEIECTECTSSKVQNMLQINSAISPTGGVNGYKRLKQVWSCLSSLLLTQLGNPCFSSLQLYFLWTEKS